MGFLNAYDHIYSRKEQLLSIFAAASLFSPILLPKCSFKARSQGGPSNGTFHFSRIHKSDSLPLAMARHQHLLFSQLHLKPGKTVLALSCGNGAICQQLVQFSNVSVIGIDTDNHLISSAKMAAEKAGLGNRLTYYHARDMCEALERFRDCSFDAAFAIELGFRTTSPTVLYEHVERLLKPCGRFASYEWCFTDEITHASEERVLAAVNLLGSFPRTTKDDSIHTITGLVASVRGAGLVNVSATDLALRTMDIPWYRPLEDHQNFRSSSYLSDSWWYGQLSVGALLAAGRLGIFSPMVLIVGEKGL